MWYFTIFQEKLHSVNIQDDQSWAFSETVQKLSIYTPPDLLARICKVHLLNAKKNSAWFVFQGLIYCDLQCDLRCLLFFEFIYKAINSM